MDKILEHPSSTLVEMEHVDISLYLDLHFGFQYTVGCDVFQCSLNPTNYTLYLKFKWHSLK